MPDHIRLAIESLQRLARSDDVTHQQAAEIVDVMVPRLRAMERENRSLNRLIGVLDREIVHASHHLSS